MDFKIRFPIWKTRSVGLAEHLLESHNTIEILYRNKDNVQIYPFIYHITKDKALEYPSQTVKGGTILKIIPIKELELFRDKKWL